MQNSLKSTVKACSAHTKLTTEKSLHLQFREKSLNQSVGFFFLLSAAVATSTTRTSFNDDDHCFGSFSPLTSIRRQMIFAFRRLLFNSQDFLTPLDPLIIFLNPADMEKCSLNFLSISLSLTLQFESS